MSSTKAFASGVVCGVTLDCASESSRPAGQAYDKGVATGAAMFGATHPFEGVGPELPGEGDLSASSRQIGRKFGEHRDANTPGYRTPEEYRNLANDIYKDPSATRTDFPFDARRYRGETHIQRGNDLLRLDASGKFLSLYRLTP